MYLAIVPGMASRTPRAAADTEARQVLELLRNSWMLALRADGKSGKTLKTYGESADQLISFLTNPPPLPEDTAAAGSGAAGNRAAGYHRDASARVHELPAGAAQAGHG